MPHVSRRKEKIKGHSILQNRGIGKSDLKTEFFEFNPVQPSLRSSELKSKCYYFRKNVHIG